MRNTHGISLLPKIEDSAVVPIIDAKVPAKVFPMPCRASPKRGLAGSGVRLQPRVSNRRHSLAFPSLATVLVVEKGANGSNTNSASNST